MAADRVTQSSDYPTRVDPPFTVAPERRGAAADVRKLVNVGSSLLSSFRLEEALVD